MKYFNVIIFIGLTLQGLGQYCPLLGPDQNLPCGVGSTTLTADLSQCGPGNNPNQTTSYNVANIPYVAQTNTGTQVFLGDDTQQGPFNIGFTFCFYGQTYSQFWIGSNGWISFSAGQPTTFTSQTIPTVNGLVPKNCVMGPWQDWHPGLGGQIRYQMQGTAPCRKLIVSWIGVPMFSCTGLQGTFHIVIYESTNIIESYIANKPNCLQWAGGTSVHGIHNAAGTQAVVVPGRNSTTWTATNDAWRWTPSGPTVNPTLVWYQVGNPIPIATGVNQITVTPPQQGAQYTCHLEYPICNAGWNTCNALSGLGPDTVLVIPGPPNLPPPTIFSFNPTCIGDCDGAINITPNGGNGVQTISWNGPTGFTPTGLCAGNYNFTITDALGCTVSGNVILTNPPLIVANPIISTDTVCYNSNALYTTTDLGPGYTYQWSTVGNIISGQGNDSIIVDWNGFPDGFIPNAVDLIAISPLGCASLPVSFDITIFNVLPIINPIGPFCSNEEFVILSATPSGGVFNGDGVIVNEFHPSIANTPNNTINYTYIQSGCVFDTNINVIVNQQPILSQITPYNDFFEICEGDSIPSIYSVTSTLPGGYNEWELLGNITQSNTFNINWSAPGMFTLSVVNWVNGCPSPQQQTTITIVRCPELLFYLPNAFTPDGDEHNNTFQPIFTSGFDPYNFNLKIYNRWGETIFESNNPLEYWDGTYQLSTCPAGIYTYILQFKDINNDGKYSFGGHVSLIR